MSETSSLPYDGLQPPSKAPAPMPPAPAALDPVPTEVEVLPAAPAPPPAPPAAARPAPLAASAFDRAFAVTVGIEGGYGRDPRDRGNWTGGRVGAGELRGTKYGISAAAHPGLDIAALTLAGAKAIYRAGYWDAVRGDELPAPLALLAIDAAVNNGPGAAVRWLQASVGVPADGRMGPRTLAAVAASHGRGAAVLVAFQDRRLAYDEALGTWGTYGHGWQRRVLATLLDAALGIQVIA